MHARWTDEHSRLVSRAAPEVSAASDDEVIRTWDGFAGRLTTAHERPRRHVRLVVGAGLAAIVLGAGGVAAANVYSSHTGRGPADPEDLRLGGPGERLDMGAPDFRQVISQATSDVPFPSAEARDAYLSAEADDASRETGTRPGRIFVSTGAIRYWAARSAVCAWADTWAAATVSGDSSGRALAAGMLEDSPTWPAVAAVYPNPGLDDPGGYFPLIRDAARSDNLADMGAVLAQWGSCQPYGADMPNLPQATMPPDQAITPSQ